MANNVDRLSRNVHRIVERADIQIPPAPKFPAEAVTGPTIGRLAAVARFNGDLQKWRNDRWSVDAPFVTEAELSRSITKVSDDQALLTTRLEVGLQDVTDLKARVTTLETSVTNIDARVTILESEIGTAVPHTILDAVVHTDSVTQTVTRGALIYGNATPKWDLLTIGPPGTYTRSDGLDVAWSSVVATEITGTLGVDHGGTGAVTLTGIIQGTGVVPLTGITGTANYFPKWSATAPFLTSTSLIFGDGVAVGIGQIVPLNRLHVTMTDAFNSTVVDVLRLHHAVGGLTGMANMGTGLLFTGKSDSVDDREMARIQTLWTTAGDASRTASLQFQTAASGAMATKVTITGGGLVGIGTTAPQTNLTFPVSSSGITLFNTADMTTNFERGVIAWSNSRLEIGITKGGTGGSRIVNFIAPTGQFNFGRTSGTAGRFEMNVETLLSGDNLNLILFRPAAAVTAGGFGTAWATSGFYLPTSGGPASYSWFGVYPTVTVSGTYSATDFSVLRISPELSGIVGITSVYLINAGTNSGTANQGTHTRMFSVNNSGSTQMAGGLVVGSILTAPVGGTYYAFLNDAPTATASTMMTVNHGSSGGSPAAGFGTDILYKLESDSTADQDAGALRVAWTTATNANRTAAMYFRLVNNAASIATSMVLSAAGGLSVGSGTLDALPVGVINAVTGFRANNAAPSGQFLRGDGTNFVASAILLADLPAGSGVTFDNPTALVSTAAVNGVATTAMRSDAAPAIDQGMGPTWTGGHTWNLGTTSPLAAISLDIAALGAAGTRSSHAIFLRGRSNDGTPHNIDWQYWVNVTSNAGASYFTLEQRIDAVAFASRLNIYSTGLVEVPSFNIGVTQSDTYGIAIANTQPAIAGAANQQWSGPMRWEGQGWETGTSTSMKTEFRQYIAPVQGTAAPTVYWVMEHSVNDATYVEILRADSTGFVRVLKDAIGNPAQNLNTSSGLQITNTTLAAAGAQQQSPAMILTGSGYHTTTGAGPDTVSFRQQVVPVEGTSAVGGYWRLDSKMGGSSYTSAGTLMLNDVGGMSLGAIHLASAIPFGVFSVQVGYRIAGSAPTVRHYLRSNGTHFIDGVIDPGDLPAGTPTGFANPTASVGLTAVNGVATTAMRSDAAPPLSQAIIPTWTGQHIWQYNGLGVTPDATKALLVTNDTAAAAGAQQISPSLIFRGRGWKTDAVAASQTVDFRMHVLPVQGTANPDGVLKIQNSINGSSYEDIAWLHSDIIGNAIAPGITTVVAGGINLYSNGTPLDTDTESASFYKSASGDAIIAVEKTGTGSYRGFNLFTGGARQLAMDALGRLRVGDNSNPSTDARFQVAAGTSALASIHLTTGVVLTTPTAGSVEYDGNFSLTKVNNVRLGIGGSLTYSTTQTGNTALTETDLFTTSIAAGTGSANGATVELESSGTFATSISTDKRVRAYWAGVLIFDSGNLNITTTQDWALYVTIIRVDATNFKSIATLNTSSASLSAYADYASGASTWANANTLKITGQGTNASDVVGEFWKVNYKV